jgi:hypothetical protein
MTETHKYLPKPNRVLGWRRDILHGVAPITHGGSDRLRLLMVTSWGSEGIHEPIP